MPLFFAKEFQEYIIFPNVHDLSIRKMYRTFSKINILLKEATECVYNFFCIINLKIFSYLHGLVLQLVLPHKRNLKAIFCSLLIYLKVIYDLQIFLICQQNNRIFTPSLWEAIFCDH